MEKAHAFLVTLLLAVALGAAPATWVEQTDVLIAGGTTAAVDYAVKMREARKRVFIVSPRPYFGEDTAGRFELPPIPPEDELAAETAKFDMLNSGRGRAMIDLGKATDITRVELRTTERWTGSITTKEAHFITIDEKGVESRVRPLAIEMCTGSSGEYIWRAKVGVKARKIAVGATGLIKSKPLQMKLMRVYRRCDPDARHIPTPLEMKRHLDHRLLAAKVDFITGAMPIEPIIGADGAVVGARFAARDGVREVRAAEVVDAAIHGSLIRASGGEFAPLPKTLRLSRTVLSGGKPAAEGLTVEETAMPPLASVNVQGKKAKLVPKMYRCSFDWEVQDDVLGWAAADQRARELTFHRELIDAGDELGGVPVRKLVRGVKGLAYLGTDGVVQREGRALGRGGVPPPPVPSAVGGGTPTLPEIAAVDVVVAGAGSAGAAATIAAAMGGAKTLAVEYQYGLGGLGTLGMIGYYWYGEKRGFTKVVDNGTAWVNAVIPAVGKREWWRKKAVKEGATLLLGSMAYGVVVENDKVVAVKVATPYGAGIVRCQVAVDATGAADLAASAGERTEFIGAGEFALQNSGVSPRRPGCTYCNSDIGYVNDNDSADAALFHLRVREGGLGEWDFSPITGTRERRRLVGAFRVEPEDVFNERKFPDTIARGSTDFDTHGPTVADVCFLSPATDKHVFKLNVPYRALLPAKTEGLLVAGIGVSAHRDAQPFLRMQADVQNIGYAAGRAAAMCAAQGVSPRKLDVKQLQRHLEELDSIPKGASEWKDEFPLSDEAWAQAVREVGDAFKGVPLVLTDRARAKRDLKAALKSETDSRRRLAYAQVLGMLGESDGAAELVAELSKDKKDFVPVVPEKAKRFGKRMSGRETMLVALGRSRSPLAVPVLKAEIVSIKKDSSVAFIRAVTLAAEALGDRSLAPELAAAVERGGNWSVATAEELTPIGGYHSPSRGGTEGYRVTRELHLLRALYALGDHDGVAKERLRKYAADPRGVYSAHARAVLQTH